MKRTVAFLALAIAAGLAGAAEFAGTVKSVKGSVNIERSTRQLTVAIGDKVFATDRILTGADSSVGITLRDNTLLSAGPNSVLNLDKFAFDPTTHAGAVDATIVRGTLGVISGKIAKATPAAVRFRTPTVTLGVRGTEFVVEVEEAKD